MTWAELGIEAIACTVVIAGFILLCIAVHHGERAARLAWRIGSAPRRQEASYNPKAERVVNS
jgi:hypothetical protein